MRAEELIALAAAHGIDLKHVAGASSNIHGLARRRRRGRDELKRSQGRPLTDSARGSDDAGGAAPDWTIAELGQAAAGLDELPWLAACYSFAGAQTAYWPLCRALAIQAVELRVRYSWPAQITDISGQPRFYCEELAHLVLDEDANKPLFTAAPQLYCLYMRVSEQVWERSLLERFTTLQYVYQKWLSQARSYLQHRIMEDEE